MAFDAQELHVALFPFMAHGHMIPTLDIARLFAARGVRATIITTPSNAPTFIKAVSKDLKIDVEAIRFFAEEVGLPEGCENMDTAIRCGVFPQLIKAAESDMLKEQIEKYLSKTQPTCLIADMFFPWATESAAKFNIPRLVFHGTSYFALCVQEILRLHTPYRNVSSDEEPFMLPLLPHAVQLTRSQLPRDVRNDEDDFIHQMKESELKSYGVLVNSFFELEPDYASFFTENLGRRAWHIGPVALSNKSLEEQAHRGRQASVSEHECLEWLNSKKPDSVIYICFGSSAYSSAPQLHEIAVALLDSGLEFIWVVKNGVESLPAEFDQRTKGKGLVINGWAPQVLILEHEAVGAFVTHCGWNSILEAISAGVPMVTWPCFAEQFYNEKLVNVILKIGVPVGAKEWTTAPSIQHVVKHDAVEKALRKIMEGEEVEDMKSRAKKFKEMARKAVEEGGSSYSDLSALIEKLRARSAAR